jgi:hypothetical protein
VVEDHAGDVTTASGDGHVKGPRHQFGAHVLGHGEADNTARSEIEHVGQVEPALGGRDVGVMRSCA